MTEQRTHALVTGASGGIGEAFARQLASRGYSLILTARREQELARVQREITRAHNVSVDIVSLDLSEIGSAERLYETVKRRGHVVDVLINNAGFGLYGDFLDGDRVRIEQMVQLNVATLTSLTHLFGVPMKERRHGYILLVASIASFQPSPFYAAYAATKAYVLWLGEALAWECRNQGVHVATICPGITRTEFHEVAHHERTGWMEFLSQSPDDVAIDGLDALFSGRSSITSGLVNKLSGTMVKFLPRRLQTIVAAHTMRAGR